MLIEMRKHLASNTRASHLTRNCGLNLANKAFGLGSLEPENVEIREYVAASNLVDVVDSCLQVCAVNDVLQVGQDLTKYDGEIIDCVCVGVCHAADIHQDH